MEYRINGFEQIKAFYSIVFEQKYDIKPQHISLYIFLINQNNRNNWVEWFKCPFDLAMSGACIGSKKTYYSCLSDLQEWGFIKYEKGINDYKAPKIMIEVIKCTSTVPQSEPLPIPLPIPQGIQAVEQLPTHIYKLLTDNIKTINNKQKEFFEYVYLFFNKKQEIKFNFEKALLGLGVNSEIVKAYLSVRKKKKLVDTEIAFNGLLREIDKSGLTPKEAITICVEKSWGGFNHEWLTNIKQPTPTYSQGTYNPTQQTVKPAGWFEPIPIKD